MSFPTGNQNRGIKTDRTEKTTGTERGYLEALYVRLDKMDKTGSVRLGSIFPRQFL